MTRRRFYAPPEAFAADEQSVALSADETRHARDVLRLQRGDEVFVFDGAGREFRGVVETINRDESQLSALAEVEPARPESSLNLTLAIALLKGEKFDLVIQKATELGVRNIIPLDTHRADVRLRDGDGVSKRVVRWRRIALESAKQTGRAFIPEICAPLTFRSWLTPTGMEERIPANAARLMFSERGGRSLLEATNSFAVPPNEIVAVVGPEGGWTDEEIELARDGGLKIITLGGRTLRAETAAIAVAALLQHRFGDLV